MHKHNWELETRMYTDNLLRVYALATKSDIDSGKRWYYHARAFVKDLAKHHGVTVSDATGVLSALSPGTEWSRNKRIADLFLAEYRINGATVLERLDLASYGRAPLLKAYRILQGERPLNILGQKTRAFYRAILHPGTTKSVVIDSHAKSAALGERFAIGPYQKTTFKVERAEYEHLERAYIAAAQTVGLTPNAFQAVVWLTWKALPVGFTLNPPRALGKAA